MPKLVKKKPTAKPKSPASDPILRARQMFDEHMEKAGKVHGLPPDVPNVNLSKYMAEIGRSGGKIGGKRRLETMSPDARKRVATKAAKARWSKAKKPVA